MNKSYYTFVRSHNLVNRIYDMLVYMEVIKHTENVAVTKKFFRQRLEDVEYVEELAKFFERKLRLKKYKKNGDVRCNLIDLIYDLDYLKQYLD